MKILNVFHKLCNKLTCLYESLSSVVHVNSKLRVNLELNLKILALWPVDTSNLSKAQVTRENIGDTTCKISVLRAIK